MYSFLANAQDCHLVFEMKVPQHHIENYYSIQFCGVKEKYISAKYNDREQVIAKKYLSRIKRQLSDRDPAINISKLEKNCKDKNYPIIEAFYHQEGEKKKKLCLYQDSIELFHYQDVVKGLVLSKRFRN